MLESIRELRRRKNFTLRQLSEKTGYTVSFLSQLERGIKNPSLDALRAIAQALDVSLVSLMNNSDYTAGSRGETGDDAGESGFCVLPPDGRRTMPIDLPGVRYQLLNAQQLALGHAGDVTMVLCTLQPGCSSSGKMVSHLYTEVCFVIAGRIRALRGRAALILTTNDLGEAEQLADSIAVLSHGRLAALGTTEELMARAGAASFEDAFVRLAGGEG